MVIDLKTKSPVPTDTYDGHFGRVDGRRHAGRDLLVPVSCAEGDVNKERKRGGFRILSSTPLTVYIFSIRVLHTCSI